MGGVRYLRLPCLFVCDCDLNGKRLELLPTNCVSPPGKHVIPLSLSTCLNSFLTVFHPDPCVLPIHISLPVQLATFPLGSFCVCTFYLDSLPAHIRSIDTLSTFKRHLKFHLFPVCLYRLVILCQRLRFVYIILTLYKFVRMYCMYVCSPIILFIHIPE